MLREYIEYWTGNSDYSENCGKLDSRGKYQQQIEIETWANVTYTSL